MGLSKRPIPIDQDTVTTKDDAIKAARDMLTFGVLGFVRPDLPTEARTVAGFVRGVLTLLAKMSPLGKVLTAAAAALAILEALDVDEKSKEDDDCTCRNIDEWIESNSCDCKG